MGDLVDFRQAGARRAAILAVLVILMLTLLAPCALSDPPDRGRAHDRRAEPITAPDRSYPGEMDTSALATGAVRAVSMQGRAAPLCVPQADVRPALAGNVRETTRTRHEPPSGDPRGGLAWPDVPVDTEDPPIHASGGHAASTGALTHDESITPHGVRLGISSGFHL